MKRILHLAVIAFFLSSVQTAQSVIQIPTSNNFLFQDDFNDGNADGWQVLTGNWSVINQEYVCQLQGFNLRCTSEAGESIWADYVVEAKIKIIDGIDAGIDVRRSTSSRYSINLRRSGAVDSPDVRLWKTYEGQDTLLSDVSFSLQANTPYSVRIQLSGANIQVSIDGEKVIDFTDVSSPIVSGKIALVGWTGGWGASEVHFDDVVVLPIFHVYLPAISKVIQGYRDAIIGRAKLWVDAQVPYNQNGQRDGYRTDCSGFVSYAWQLKVNGQPVSPDTVTLGTTYTVDTSFSALQPGDIINNERPGNSGHVVMFINWIDQDHTKFVAYEENGGYGKAVQTALTLENIGSGFTIKEYNSTAPGPYFAQTYKTVP
jgi:hypothetical protein